MTTFKVYLYTVHCTFDRKFVRLSTKKQEKEKKRKKERRKKRIFFQNRRAIDEDLCFKIQYSVSVGGKLLTVW